MKLVVAIFLTMTAISLAMALAVEPSFVAIADPAAEAMMDDRTGSGVVSWTADGRWWFAVVALGALLIAAFYWARGRRAREEEYVRKVDPCVYGGEEHNVTPL